VSEIPRYVGQSNAYDIPNNIIYLGSLEYAWDVGDSLSGWTLGGTTVPTIAADGRMRLYDATPGGGSSNLYYPLNIRGNLNAILHFKFTRMLDDVMVAPYSFAGVIESWLSANPAGAWYQVADFVRRLNWTDTGFTGTYRATVPALPMPTPGVEYAVDVVMTPTNIILLIDNVKYASIAMSERGSSPLSRTARQDYFGNLKSISFGIVNGVAGVSHYRIRDIRVSAYRGQS